MSRRHVSRFVVVNETLLYRYITLHYRVCEREKKKLREEDSGERRKLRRRPPPLSCFFSFPLLSSPRRARSTRFSRIRWYSNRQYNTRGYANTRAPNVSRYVKRTRTTHSRSEFTGVVSLFHLYQPCITAAVFGQRKQHGK